MEIICNSKNPGLSSPHFNSIQSTSAVHTDYENSDFPSVISTERESKECNYDLDETLLKNSFNGPVVMTCEPLKVGLDSDDSSIESSCDSDCDSAENHSPLHPHTESLSGVEDTNKHHHNDNSEGILSSYAKSPMSKYDETMAVSSESQSSNLNGCISSECSFEKSDLATSDSISKVTHQISSFSDICIPNFSTHTKCQDNLLQKLTSSPSSSCLRNPKFPSSDRKRKLQHFNLKQDNCNTNLNQHKTSVSTNLSSKRKRRRVTLHDMVSVIPIPQRSEYTTSQHSHIWTTSEELYANAARNSIEFASEGWNWRTVTEDEDMLYHKSTKQLVHPVHLRNVLVSYSDGAMSNSPKDVIWKNSEQSNKNGDEKDITESEDIMSQTSCNENTTSSGSSSSSTLDQIDPIAIVMADLVPYRQVVSARVCDNKDF